MSAITEQMGQLLGTGSFREVYAVEGDDTTVIKKARQDEAYHNWMEWFLWNSAPAYLRPYLAPVKGITPDGKYLKMARVNMDKGDASTIPDEARMVIMDQKFNNLGLLNEGQSDERTVFVDYALFTIPGWNDAGIAPNLIYKEADGMISAPSHYSHRGFRPKAEV